MSVCLSVLSAAFNPISFVNIFRIFGVNIKWKEAAPCRTELSKTTHIESNFGMLQMMKAEIVKLFACLMDNEDDVVDDDKKGGQLACQPFMYADRSELHLQVIFVCL